MEELSTLLIVFGYGAGAGTFGTLVLALLFAIFLNTRKESEDDDGSLVIPYSALAGGMGGGPPQTMTVADMMRIRAVMAAQEQGDSDKKDDKKADKSEIGGNYI